MTKAATDVFTRKYTYSEVDTALAIFDAYQDVSWMIEYRQNNGTADLRRLCTVLAPLAEKCWAQLSDAERDDTTWDFEFIPAWLEEYNSCLGPATVDGVRTQLKKMFPDMRTEMRKVLEKKP